MKKTLKLTLTNKQHLALLDAIESHLQKIYCDTSNEANDDRKKLIAVRSKLYDLDFYAQEEN